MEIGKLEKEYTVHVYETRPDERLNLHSLFDYFQDIASDHAVNLGFGRDDLMKQNHFWVLSRMYAEISYLPFWGEKILVKTWPRGVDKIFALRDYEVHTPDGRLIASATSSWLIIDQTTRKIQRPDSNLTYFHTEMDKTSAMKRNPEKINPASPDGRLSQQFKVNISDLDVNLHTNNVKYIKWVTDSYDSGFITNNIPFSAEINYIAESRIDEQINIRTSVDKENENVYNHSIMRTSDNVELCRVRIVWNKCQVK